VRIEAVVQNYAAKYRKFTRIAKQYVTWYCASMRGPVDTNADYSWHPYNEMWMPANYSR